MTDTPTLCAPATKSQASKCPQCGGLLLRHTEYDSQFGEDHLLKCPNCGYERQLATANNSTPPSSKHHPLPEPQPPAKRHFQRRTRHGAWPPEAHSFIAEIVNSQTGRKPKEIAAAAAASSNIPAPTVLAWINSGRYQYPNEAAAPTQPTPEHLQPEPNRAKPSPPDYQDYSQQEPQPDTPPLPDRQPAPASDAPAELARQLIAAAAGRVLTRLEITPQTIILETEPPPTDL